MEPADNIRKLIKKLQVEPSADMDRKVHSRITKALEKCKETRTAATPPNIWRTIMKSKIAKLSTAAMIIMAIIFGLNIIGDSDKSGRVYANVVQQIRNARTVTFTTEVQLGQQTMRIEMAHKEPGLSRTVGGNTVRINDMTQRRAIVIDHSRKQYTERDLELPDEQPQDFFENMRSLPDRATEVLAKKEMNGRMVQGFRVIEHGIDATVWIDVQTGDLARMEGQFPNAPNTLIVGTDFKFDIELDNAFFSLKPPAGYIKREPPNIDRSEVNCQDLIGLLRWWATTVGDGLFPPSLDPVEFAEVGNKMREEGRLSGFKGRTQDEKMERVRKLARGMQFVMMMRPENDWHYAGKGVKLGDADAAICRYRPQGSQTYRVIYGDLSLVEDVDSEDLPE